MWARGYEGCYDAEFPLPARSDLYSDLWAVSGTASGLEWGLREVAHSKFFFIIWGKAGPSQQCSGNTRRAQKTVQCQAWCPGTIGSVLPGKGPATGPRFFLPPSSGFCFFLVCLTVVFQTENQAGGDALAHGYTRSSPSTSGLFHGTVLPVE